MNLLPPLKVNWAKWSVPTLGWLPYVSLVIPTILAVAQMQGITRAHVESAGLVIVAAVWTYVLYTRAPQPREQNLPRMGVYFVGLLLWAWLLMVRQPIFFVYALSGFFHAALLRPFFLSVLGVAATSTLINTLMSGFPWPTIEQWFIFSTIIVVQTVTIGFGIISAEKGSQLSEQRRQAVERLEAALEENAGLHAQLLAQAREAGVHDERQRMAREIHDTLAQGFTGIITQLEAAKQASQRPEDQQRHLDNAVQLARQSLAEARRSVEALRPQMLEKAELPTALADLADQWSKLNGVPAQTVTVGAVIPLHAEVELALLRTAQEALANVAKHAHAARAGITLAYMDDVITLDIRDDGVGFNVENNSHGAGFGLTAMRQRLARVAGVLSVESEPGGGTAISARVPAIAKLTEGIDA